jgi:hypothetical protein
MRNDERSRRAPALLAIAALLAALAPLGRGCVPSGDGPPSTGGAPPDGGAGYRLSAMGVRTSPPTGTIIFNGVLAAHIADGTLDLLVQVTSFAPEAAARAGLGTETPGGYLIGAAATGYSGAYDAAARRLAADSTTAFILVVAIDVDGVDVPVFARFARSRLGLDFSPALDAILDSSVLVGEMTVDDACATELELDGEPTNLLDLLDGEGPGTTAPDLAPPCAPGDGPANVLPDADSDGDGVPDAYTWTFSIAGDAVPILD